MMQYVFPLTLRQPEHANATHGHHGSAGFSLRLLPVGMLASSR